MLRWPLAAETRDAPTLIEACGDDISQQAVVHAALELERNNKRDEAMALLQRHQALGTDVQGTLAGRIKRMWIENENLSFAQHALSLYQEALDVAAKNDDKSQIYYHSINVAFLEFVAFDRVDRAREMAKLAFKNASLSEPGAWSTATQAEANLYLATTMPLSTFTVACSRTRLSRGNLPRRSFRQGRSLASSMTTTG